MHRRVVVTGMGMVTPLGVGVEESWANLLDGKSHVSPIPESWRDYAKYTSTIWSPLPKIDYDVYGIRRTQRNHLDPGQILTLIAAGQAVGDAGLKCEIGDKKKATCSLTGIDPDRCGVYLGTGIGGVVTLATNIEQHCFSPMKPLFADLRRRLEGPGGMPASAAGLLKIGGYLGRVSAGCFNPFSVSMVMPNASGANIGIKYGLTGPNVTFCSACAAGTVGLGHAFRAIRNGSVDLAITGGVEYLRDEIGGMFRAFDVAGALVSDCNDPETANRPFDEHRSGFLFSEGGAAMLIFEEESHARRRGARILAEVTAFTESFDAHSIMGMRPDGDKILLMLQSLMKQAGRSAGEIDYVNAHGTGTTANDEVEATVIAKMWGDRVLVNSTKSLLGHTIGASGAIGAVTAILSIRDQRTHICRNLDHPILPLNFVRTVASYPIRRAVTQAFAFGGHNAALLLEEYRESRSEL